MEATNTGIKVRNALKCFSCISKLSELARSLLAVLNYNGPETL